MDIFNSGVTMPGGVKRLFVALAISFLFLSHIHTYFFLDNFSSQGNWITNLRYNLSLGVWTNIYVLQGGDVGPQLTNWVVTGGKMNFGSGYNATPVGYTTSFYGIYSLFTNRSFNASKKNPYGFEITRITIRQDNGTESWQAGSFDLCMVQAKPSVTNGNTLNGLRGEKFDNLVNLTETDWQNKSSASYYGWSQSIYPNSKIDLTAVTDSSGTTANLSSLLEVNYSAGANNNVVTFRLVNDGEYVYWYVNPNPLNVGSYTNAFYLVDKKPVVFSNNLQPMIGIGAINYNGFSVCQTYGADPQSVQMSNLVMRSVCSNIVSELTPARIRANSSARVYLAVRPLFSTNDEAGVGELYVDIPESVTNFTNWTAYTNALSVHWAGTNGALFKNFTNDFGDKNPSPGNVAISLKEGGRRLKIRFCSSNSIAASDVFHPLKWGGEANSNVILLVVSNYLTSSNADSVGRTLEVSAANEKYFDTTWTNTATTGPMASAAGNVMDMSQITNSLVDSDSLTYRTYNSPVAYSGLSPTRVYEGVATVYIYDVQAANLNNNSDVDKLMVIVPPHFGVDTNTLYSEKMAVSNSQYLYLTNFGGTNAVVADYLQRGTFLPANAGWDTLTIRCTNTTNVPDGSSGVTVNWPAQVYSSLTLNWTNTLTNALYPSQSLLVRKKPPQASFAVTPHQLSNTLVSNVLTFTVKNNATEDPNRVKLLRIRLPASFTNVAAGVSASNAVVSVQLTNGSNWVTVSYTNTPPDTYIPANGGSDLVTLTLLDSIPSLSDITDFGIGMDADNLNGDGWTAMTVDPSGTGTVTFFTPPASAYGYIANPGPETTGNFHHVYTDADSETNLILVIENRGEEGNEISRARIFFPKELTNVLYTGNTKIARASFTNEISNAGGGVSNTNFVLYLDYTNTLKPKTGAVAAEQDAIYLRVWDAVDTPAVLQLEVFVKNAKTNDTRASETPDNARLTYIYPPVSAKGSVSVPDGFIDWSSSTNTVTYEITNTGRVKNAILQAQILVPTDIATNLDSVTSSRITNAAYINYNSGVLTLNYSTNGGYGFPGGQKDTVTFLMHDVVTNTLTLRITNRVTNSRTNVVLLETTAGSQSVDFRTPPVLARFQVEPGVLFVRTSGSETNQLTLTLTNLGRGNNHINLVEISMPFDASRIAVVSNEIMDANSVDDPSLVSVAGNKITLVYTNSATNHSAGLSDRVVVSLVNDFTNEQDLGWSVTGDNDVSDAVPLTNIGVLAGGTNRTWFAERAQVSLDPVVIFTSTESNSFKYSVKNGTLGSPVGRPVSALKIVVSDPFTNVRGVTIEQPGTTAVTNINASTRWILVNYSSGLQAGEADNIRFVLDDNWAIGTNYSVLGAQADYADGGGWRDTAVEIGKSVTVSFSFPPASGTGYITAGEFVPEDFTNYTYEFYLKNTGDSGNNIKIVKFTPPAAITNITSVTCLTKQLSGVYDGTNVWIDYDAAGKDLLALETDTIRMIGFDSVATGTVQSQWRVQVANATTNDESYRADITVPAGKTLSNIIYTPNVKAAAYLEALNAIDGSESNRNKVWTTRVSNTFNYYIYNQSGSGNNMTRVWVSVPGGADFFDTNSLQVTNSRAASITLTNDRTAFEIVYDSPIVPGDYDAVQIKVNDLYLYGETNFAWTNAVAYDTTDNRYKAGQEYAGKSWQSYFLMPSPAARAGIVSPLPREVYTRTTNFVLGFRITNTGDGSGDIFRARITLPEPYRALFNAADASNSLATNAAYDGGTGVLTLDYSNNFVPGSNDTVYLTLRSAVLTPTNHTFACQVDNAVYASGVSDLAVDGRQLDIVTVPTYYVTPNALSTTTASNDVNVFILNNTGGKAKVQKVVLEFSSPFTGILMTNSLVITNRDNIYGMITSLTLDYVSDGNELSSGGNDAVTFRLSDGLAVGDTNAGISARAHNGSSWVLMDQDVSGSTNVAFTMPAAAATAKLSYNQFYTTTGQTNMAVTVYNKGTGSNGLSRFRFAIPQALAGLTVLSNQFFTDAGSSIAGNVVTVQYQNTNLVPAAGTDVVWLSFSNTLESATNMTITAEAVNLTNGDIEGRYVAVPGEGGAGALNLRVEFPAVTVQGYINGRSSIFTINTNDRIEYRILNGSLNTSLTSASIPYDSNLIRVAAVSNTWAGSVVNNTGSAIEIDYSANAIPFSQRDIITLYLNYSITNVTNTMLTSTVVLTGVTNGTFGTVNAGYTQVLSVNDALWGKLKGEIFPRGYAVAAKLYQPGTSVLATNIDGELAGTVTGTNGEYAFSFIPAGDYTLELAASRFRTYRGTVTILSNMENLVSIITMQNAVLDPDSLTNQTVASYESTNSRVEFPVAGLERDMSLDIRMVDLTAEQKADLNRNSKVKAPSTTAGLQGYWFDIRNLPNAVVEGEVLKLDAIIYLGYDATDIASRGWSETELSAYYWDRVAGRWTKMGGTVDSVNKQVVLKAGFLHDLYGVFGGVAADGVIRNVAARPKIFTPTKSADGYFGNVRITFELDALQAPDGYEVRIFDLRGNLVKSFARKGSYNQGEVAWDSRDDDGYPVKGGVYIYRVLAGGQVYSGTIVIVR